MVQHQSFICHHRPCAKLSSIKYMASSLLAQLLHSPLFVTHLESCDALIAARWQAYFTWWVVLSLVWALIATVLATFLPIIEAWRILAVILASILPCIPGLKSVAAKNQARPLETESPPTPIKEVPLPVEKPT